MSDSNAEQSLTGFDLWTANDYSNFITISAAAIGSILLVVFKSRCKKINLCCGLVGCDREVQSDEEVPDPPNQPNQPPGGALVNPPQAQAPDPVQNP